MKYYCILRYTIINRRWHSVTKSHYEILHILQSMFMLWIKIFPLFESRCFEYLRNEVKILVASRMWQRSACTLLSRIVHASWNTFMSIPGTTVRRGVTLNSPELHFWVWSVCNCECKVSMPLVPACRIVHTYECTICRRIRCQWIVRIYDGTYYSKCRLLFVMSFLTV